MKKGIKTKLLSAFLIVISMFLFAAMKSYALINSLSSVEVQEISNDNYKILLKLDKNSQVKKYVDKNDNLNIVINSTLPSENMEIINDNAEDLSNIIVQKKNGDSTLILLKGENIKNAQIYTKDLTTGIEKKINTQTNVLSNVFFIADKKILAISLLTMFIFFFTMLISRPKEKRYQSVQMNDKNTQNLQINTLRNKNLIQSKTIPSINYRANGSFHTSTAYMSMPKEFVNTMLDEEKIKKAC